VKQSDFEKQAKQLDENSKLIKKVKEEIVTAALATEANKNSLNEQKIKIVALEAKLAESDATIK
jgi:hypothetical protein